MTNRAGAVLIALGALAVAMWLVWLRVPPPPEPPLPIEVLLQRAHQLQEEENWCEAEKAWSQVLDRMGDDDSEQSFREDALQNRDLARSNCQPGEAPIAERDIPRLPEDKRPKEVPEDEIARFYTRGKTVRSVAIFNITGTGTNTAWTFKKDAYFAYEYRMVIETKVVDNQGTAVVFEQSFPEVVQVRAESQEELELHLPESPILAVVWQPVDRELGAWPPYAYGKRIAELINIADPRLRHTLTTVSRWLKRNGVALLPDDDIAITVRPDRLAGLRFEIKYVSGLGVTHIKVLDGKELDPDRLRQLAYVASLFMDYFLAEGARKPANEPFDVRVQDVGAIFGLPYDVDPSGKLTFRKQREEDRDGERLSILELVGGDVLLQGTVDGIERSGEIKPLSGIVHYSDDKLLVPAQATWQANARWFSKDHLLFGTEAMRNVKVETYYEADVKSP